ncbi:MAG: hypothetical protein AB1689_07735 [Thermodesulfobacteriota bacterium]
MPPPVLRARNLGLPFSVAASTVALSTALLLGPAIAQGSGEPRRVVITPQPSNGTLRTTVGNPLKLSARLEIASGATVPLDEHVSWSSSDPSVLRVSSGGDGLPPGSVTPIRPGVAAVTVIYPPIAPPASAPRPPYPAARPLGDAVTIVVGER